MNAKLTVVRGGQSFHRPQVPAHIVERFGTGRKWKALKRAQLRTAQQAFNAVRDGCAFFPRPVETKYDAVVEQIQKGLAELEWRLSRKVWGQ